MESEDPEGDQEKGAPVIEWVIAAVCGVLLIGIVVFLLYDAGWRGSSPPQITIEVDSITHTAGGYLVEFEILNGGGTTAAGLLVEGELPTGSGAVEMSSVTIDYLPSKSSRRAGLLFDSDPRNHELEIRPKGFARP